MNYGVVLSKRALNDLRQIYAFVAEQASTDVADAFFSRIDERLQSLTEFPHRGRPRHDLGRSLRSVPFERSATILYRVRGATVRIARVIARGRDIDQLFEPSA